LVCAHCSRCCSVASRSVSGMVGMRRISLLWWWGCGFIVLMGVIWLMGFLRVNGFWVDVVRFLCCG